MKKKRKIGYWLTKREVILLGIVSVFLLISICLFSYRYICTYPYRFRTLPDSYLGSHSISDVSFSSLDSTIDSFRDDVLNEKITFLCNGKEYSYSYHDLGVELDKDSIIDYIIEYQGSLDFLEMYDDLVDQEVNTFPYFFSYDEESLRTFLTNLKAQVDVLKVDGYFSMDDNRNLQYISGTDGYSLDIEKSLVAIVDFLENPTVYSSSISLEGTTEKASSNELYQSVDTKVSSFSTEFDPYITRATNLRVALNYIDGAIVEPGEVFSFYEYAGPYNKDGYVFYYEFVGNGVCQIATTVYNTALLGGLEIVKRYPHAAKSPYVPGGLDATVASYSSGWNVDFQFKNTYQYPIYISAYAVGGEAHVDFWSNKDAMGGKTYSTESVQIGTRGYTTYLHTYQDGVEISRDKIATTWYSED